ncbi:MAG: hypothetical protein AAFX77_17795 [Pseudomonadota bacterium]
MGVQFPLDVSTMAGAFDHLALEFLLEANADLASLKTEGDD